MGRVTNSYSTISCAIDGLLQITWKALGPVVVLSVFHIIVSILVPILLIANAYIKACLTKMSQFAAPQNVPAGAATLIVPIENQSPYMKVT